MKRMLLWVTASIVTFALIVSLVIGFIGSLSVGFAGAIQACGISILTATRQEESAKYTSLLTATTFSSSTSTSVAPAPLGPAAEAYFEQFSPSQQVEMKKNAAIIVSEGVKRPEKLTRHDIKAAVGVAIQESHITNLLVATDHDSLGIFQQRPSVGSWGTAAQIVDPVHATNKFYDELVTIPADQRQQMALIDIGIKVQRPSKAAYLRTWKWDSVANDIVATYMSGEDSDLTGTVCIESSGVSTGEWQNPLAEGSYCFVDEFGMRLHPISGQWKMHNGIDMACNNGDPIYASRDGKIGLAGSNGGYGNFVSIDHGADVQTHYAHMSRIADGISNGTQVVAGQVIGYVGSTGGSTGAHLHFEVKVKGKFVDPLEYMQKQGVTIK